MTLFIALLIIYGFDFNQLLYFVAIFMWFMHLEAHKIK